MNKQEKVLKEIYYSFGKEMTVEELERETGLKKWQVHNALVKLNNRRLIIKKRKDRKARYKIPPIGKLYIKIDDKCPIERIKRIIGK